MHFIKATMGDLPRLIDFYNEVIDHTRDLDIHARWKKNIYPTKTDIMGYIENDAMYLCEDGGNIAAAMAVTMGQGEDYRDISWKHTAADSEVAVIHVLAVTPCRQGTGIGGLMIDEAVAIAKLHGKKALRLDALATNTPAQHIYLNKGFTYIGKKSMYAGNTGWTDFFFYELNLSAQ